MIDLRDARVDHHLRVLGDGHGAIEDLGDEFLHQVLAALSGGGLSAEAAFFDDLIEQTSVPGSSTAAAGRACAALLDQPLDPPPSPDFALQFVQLLGVADRFQQQLFQLVVALQACREDPPVACADPAVP